jgi:hypothetical protein
VCEREREREREKEREREREKEKESIYLRSAATRSRPVMRLKVPRIGPTCGYKCAY